MFLPLSAILLLCSAQADAAGQPLWIEGESYYSQNGSQRVDLPPFASRGACLGADWGATQDHFAVYRYCLDRVLPDTVLYLRYARKSDGDSYFKVIHDDKTTADRVSLSPTGGWGHLGQSEWRYKSIPLGRVEPGWHELKLVSLAAKNNTNVDGFFVAGPSFVPADVRREIETCRQPPVRKDLGINDPACIDAKMSFDDVFAAGDDWYYPAEESAERASLEIPVLVDVSVDRATISAADGGPAESVGVGQQWRGWRIAEILREPEPMVILEREFRRWGLLLYLGRQGPVAEIRKAVGELQAVARPGPAYPPDYFERISDAKEDLLGNKLLESGRDPRYQDASPLLAPLHSYTFIGAPESPVKYIVQPDGKIGYLPLRWGRNKPLEETVLDPASLFPLPDWSTKPPVAKRGLLGGFLPAVNYGFLVTDDPPEGRLRTSEARRWAGWEMSALMDVGPASTAFVRFRSNDGTVKHYRLRPEHPLEELSDGKPFFAALLRLQRWWERFFADGMKLKINDRRASDNARAAIALALSGYVDLHPKYGMGGYWGKDDRHDGFPPTTLSMNRCLLDWGFHQAAKDRLGYYLARFVLPDGTLNYYGPAVAEYGQLLELAAQCVHATADGQWFDRHRQAIDRLVEHLLQLRRESRGDQSADSITYGLLFGGAEADNHKSPDYFFSGSAWAWRGLLETANLFVKLGGERNDPRLTGRGKELLAESEELRSDLLRAVSRSIVASGDEAFLPPIAGFDRPFATMTQDRLASYTNYRYWLEMLSARCLTAEQERMIIDYRVSHGGEILAGTRFQEHLDNWPYWHYAQGLITHDRVRHYLLGYVGHMSHHQMPGTFTSYEQVLVRGYCFRREWADYCVPAQLTMPIMTRWMAAFERPDDGELWLCPAIPRAWLESEFSFERASTRWGPVSLQISPHEKLSRMTARLVLPRQDRPVVVLRVRHPDRLQISGCRVTGGRCEKLDASREVVRLAPSAETMVVELTFQP